MLHQGVIFPQINSQRKAFMDLIAPNSRHRWRFIAEDISAGLQTLTPSIHPGRNHFLWEVWIPIYLQKGAKAKCLHILLSNNFNGWQHLEPSCQVMSFWDLTSGNTVVWKWERIHRFTHHLQNLCGLCSWKDFSKTYILKLWICWNIP